MPTRLRLFGLPIPETALHRRSILAVSIAGVAVLACLEWMHDFGVSLGILYVLPVVVAATALTHVQVVLMALGCAFIRDQFHPPLEPIETLLRFLMASIAYSSAGLLVLEVFQNRQRMLLHYLQLRLETGLRRKAERRLEILADDSPAGILTINARSRVIDANRAAQEMFGFAEGAMMGVDIGPLVPAFSSALQLGATRRLRTSATGWARRVDGVQFPLTTWFSTYGEGEERCLAAVLVDVSEEVRDHERESFEQLRAHNHLLAGAVSHEIRNMCSAISVVSSNLSRLPELRANEDFSALQSLVRGLAEVASFQLRGQRFSSDRASLRQVLDELRVVIGPDWAEIDGAIHWETAAIERVEVRGAPHALLQTFLNLAQNSLRAVENASERRLEVRATVDGPRVVVSFIDSGHGVRDPKNLFHPFRPDADGTGLGLYISRTLMRSFSGDLIHRPTASGCRFDAVLAVAAEAESAAPAALLAS